jgi:hypothetical protein
VIPQQTGSAVAGWQEVEALAGSDATLASLLREVDALAVAYPGAALLVPPLLTANRRLVHLPALPMTPPWSPSGIAALLVCDSWPGARPQLLVHQSLKRDAAAPANFTAQYIEGDSWYSYSFNAPYDPAHPALIPVVRGWLRRFDGRP